MKAVIMAGGKGTRISSITQDEIPKSMLKVGGKPIKVKGHSDNEFNNRCDELARSEIIKS